MTPRTTSRGTKSSDLGQRRLTTPSPQLAAGASLHHGSPVGLRHREFCVEAGCRACQTGHGSFVDARPNTQIRRPQTAFPARPHLLALVTADLIGERSLLQRPVSKLRDFGYSRLDLPANRAHKISSDRRRASGPQSEYSRRTSTRANGLGPESDHLHNRG